MQVNLNINSAPLKWQGDKTLLENLEIFRELLGRCRLFASSAIEYVGSNIGENADEILADLQYRATALLHATNTFYLRPEIYSEFKRIFGVVDVVRYVDGDYESNTSAHSALLALLQITLGQIKQSLADGSERPTWLWTDSLLLELERNVNKEFGAIQRNVELRLTAIPELEIPLTDNDVGLLETMFGMRLSHTNLAPAKYILQQAHWTSEGKRAFERLMKCNYVGSLSGVGYYLTEKGIDKCKSMLSART